MLQALKTGSLTRYGGGSESLVAEGALRTTKMYEEAGDFARRMSEFERGLLTFHHATTDFMDSLIPMMSAPLPRVWDHLPDGGLAEPLRARQRLGADVDINGIRAAILEMERRLMTGISRPLGQWRDALDTARQRLPEVERLRRELAREQGGLDRTFSKAESIYRRDVGLDQPHGLAGLLFRCTHPRSASPVGRSQRGTGGQVAAADAEQPGEGEEGAAGGGGSGRVPNAVAGPGPRPFREEFRNEDRNMQTVYRARRREAVLKSFTEQEGLLNEQLSGLCRDASWLKSYMVASLVATKEGLQSVTHFLGSTKQPVPGHADEVTGRARGSVATNDELIRVVPKLLLDRSSRMQVLERMRSRMGRDGLHAHRAVASPMELHARGDISGKEHVAPARRGAAEMPLGAATEMMSSLGGGGEVAAAPAGVDVLEGGGGSGVLSGDLMPGMPASEKLTVVGGTVLPMTSGRVGE